MKRRSHLHDGARGLQRHVATRLINILGSLARSWRGLTSHTHALWIPPHTNDINHTNHTNNEYPDFKQISWSHPSLGGAGGLPTSPLLGMIIIFVQITNTIQNTKCSVEKGP